jgi:hypothetical protein
MDALMNVDLEVSKFHGPQRRRLSVRVFLALLWA